MEDFQTNWCAVCDRPIVPLKTCGSGLVRGTGHVQQLKTRVEIDQSPAPLYCSNQCRDRDIDYSLRSPHFSDSGDSSLASLSSSSEVSSHFIHRKQPPRKSTPSSRALAVLHREIGLLVPETYNELGPPPKTQPVRRPIEYTSGVMMANRRLEAVLPRPLKPGERAPPLKPVPGFTDGSQAWRASTYSFAPPPRTFADAIDPNRVAYETIVAYPHRSASSGVGTSSSHSSVPSSPTASSSTSGTNFGSELLSSFEDSLSKRTSSRLSLFSCSPCSSRASCSSSPRCRQRNISQAAKNMLLVPEVLVKPASCSSSFGSLPQVSGCRHSLGSTSLRELRIRRPLYTFSLDEEDSMLPEPEDEEEAAFIRSCGSEAQPSPRRPKTELRSWSYDNVRTYPVMAMPILKEITLIDGKQVEVEVPRKPLFTFEPIEVPVRT